MRGKIIYKLHAFNQSKKHKRENIFIKNRDFYDKIREEEGIKRLTFE